MAQAQDGLGVRDHLDRAAASAERLLTRGVYHGGAQYLPYPFDFPLHDDHRNSMHAPWYSGMAQDQALSLFVRLHALTEDPRWLAGCGRRGVPVLPHSSRTG